MDITSFMGCLLADPEMIHKTAERRMEEVRPCIGSLNCLSRPFRELPYTRAP